MVFFQWAGAEQIVVAAELVAESSVAVDGFAVVEVLVVGVASDMVAVAVEMWEMMMMMRRRMMMR